MRNSILIIMLFLLCACTRSLFINKSSYSLYKMPVVENENDKNNLKTDGYYLEIEKPNRTRDAKIFFKNGYVASLYDDDIEFKSKLKSNQSFSLKMKWYILKKDSIIIEGFGENPNEIDTYSYKYYGTINGDTLNLSFENSGEIQSYIFVQDSSMPKLINNGRYIDKKWYNENLHYSRK